MGQTQHTVGTANVRASCILLLATGNVGGRQGRQHLPRPHQRTGATDLGLDIVTLPLYYGLVEGRGGIGAAFGGRYDRLLSRFTPGGHGRAVSLDTLVRRQPLQGSGQPKTTSKAMMVFGRRRTSPACQVVKGLRRSVLVVADPHPTTWAVLSGLSGSAAGYNQL
jgi:formate dehydrogenase major subunit